MAARRAQKPPAAATRPNNRQLGSSLLPLARLRSHRRLGAAAREVAVGNWAVGGHWSCLAALRVANGFKGGTGSSCWAQKVAYMSGRSETAALPQAGFSGSAALPQADAPPALPQAGWYCALPQEDIQEGTLLRCE